MQGNDLKYKLNSQPTLIKLLSDVWYCVNFYTVIVLGSDESLSELLTDLESNHGAGGGLGAILEAAPLPTTKMIYLFDLGFKKNRWDRAIRNTFTGYLNTIAHNSNGRISWLMPREPTDHYLDEYLRPVSMKISSV